MDLEHMGDKPLVLLVHSNSAFLNLAGNTLSDAGFRTSLCSESSSANRRIRSELPDLIVLNIRLDQPELDWNVLDMHRLDPLTSAIPIVVCLPVGWLLQHPERLQRRGCVLLERPYDQRELLLAVQRALGAAGARSIAQTHVYEARSRPAAAEAPEVAVAVGGGLELSQAGAGQQPEAAGGQSLFQDALEASQRGDREEAYRLIRKGLVEDPSYVPAWLHMAELVTSVEQQQECLERALALDPGCQAAREQLDLLRLRSIAQSPRRQQPLREGARKLGGYLIDLGYITAEQLREALQEQREAQNRRGDHVPLGDILLYRGWLTPQMLASALVQQQQDKLQSPGSSPQHLGEYLVTKGVLSSQQLAMVLAEQAQRRQSGERTLLGDLLLRGGYLSPEVLEQVLDEQRSDFFARFFN